MATAFPPNHPQEQNCGCHDQRAQRIHFIGERGGGDAVEAELAERARWQMTAPGAAVEELSGNEARKREPGLSPEVIYAAYLPRDRRTDNRKLAQE
jgi:glycine/D-amino acid oxidase-like deaminating enzyme